MATDLNDVINGIWHGSIDLHVHASPDPVASRRYDAVDLATAAREAGMRGFIFKSHEYPTVAAAYILTKLIPRIEVFGAISLDDEVGGLNPQALEASAKMGARKVWMPTFSAQHWHRWRLNTGGGMTIFAEDGKMLPVVDDILSLVKQYGMILGTGHLSTEEQLALVKEARRRDIKTVVTHADFWIPVDAQVEMARLGAYIEHAFIALTGFPTRSTAAEIAAAIRAAGPGRSILSTDLGQAQNVAPPEGLRVFIATMLAEGFAPAEVEQMVKQNPSE
ncbi:MAG: DUF6282 family protein, partial [Dehalococcoidia bacterium]